MIAKTFEILDRHTFTVGLAVKLEPGSEKDRYLLARAGFGVEPRTQATYVQLVQIKGGGGRSACDPYDWGDRTWRTAHQHIIENFDRLESGAVIDVEFILGETDEPKRSEVEVAP